VFVYNKDFVPTAGFLFTETVTMSYTMYMIFESNCRHNVMPTLATHKENSIDAQNPNQTCPQKSGVCCMTNAG